MTKHVDAAWPAAVPEHDLLPSGQHLLDAASALGGAEPRALPLGVWSRFAELLRAWPDAGRPPEALGIARQVGLPELHKAVDGVLHKRHIRPICILSCWWRVASKAINTRIRTVLRPLVPNLPPTSGAENLARVSNAALFAPKAVFVTLDLQQAFDHLRPAALCRLFVKTGWPAGLARLVTGLWKD